MSMTRNSVRDRRQCFDEHKRTDESGHVYLQCHICNGVIDPARDKWDAEHVTPFAFGGTDLAPAHVKCHRQKTSEEDIPKIAKSKRASEKHFGIRKKGWGGKFRKKLSGEIEER